MHDKSRWVLFVGDHLLLKITPNIGLWTYTAPRPLQRYLDYIESLRGAWTWTSSSPGTARSSTTSMAA